MSELETEAADLWERIAQRRWGKYVTEVEDTALSFALDQIGLDGIAGDAMELGSEQGRWTRKLIDLGWHVTCTEICQTKTAQCQCRNPEATCLLVDQDDTRIPAADHSLDLLVSMEVPVTDESWFVPELRRILRSGGHAVFTFNNRSSYRGQLVNLRSRIRGDEPQYNRAYRASRRQLSAGFTILREIGFCWFPFSRFSDSRLVPFFTKFERISGLRHVVSYSPWVAVVCRKDA